MGIAPAKNICVLSNGYRNGSAYDFCNWLSNMKHNFKKELLKVAALVDDLLEKDDFPIKAIPLFFKDAVMDYPLRRGKRLRPALLIWVCGLFGGKPDSAKFAACAVEIQHAWTLVHDDIIDNDSFRRGEQSSHVKLANFARNNLCSRGHVPVKFGRDMAMLAGDCQQSWALRTLLKSAEHKLISSELCLYLAIRFEELAGRELICGEALDSYMSLSNIENLSFSDVFEISRLKTGAILRFCAEAGGLIALGSAGFSKDDRIIHISDFAEKSGLAFQLKDDWLGIFGDEKKLGKPLGSDISEKKATPLMIEILKRCDRNDKNFVYSSFGMKKISSSRIQKIREIARESGAEACILDRISDLSKDALSILEELPKNRYRRLLEEWIEYLLDRDN